MSLKDTVNEKSGENVEYKKQTPEEFRQRIIMFKEYFSNQVSSDNDLKRSRKNTL